MTLFGAIGGVFFKKYSSGKLVILLLGLTFYGLGALINIFLLEKLPYTIVFLANAFTFIWALIFAKVIFKEDIRIFKVMGVIMIFIGVVMIII